MFATPLIIGLLVGLVVLICCSAFASASETALFSLTATDLSKMEGHGGKTEGGKHDGQGGKTEGQNNKGKRAAKVSRLLDDREYTLATILILNNLVNISIVLLSAFIINRTIEFKSPVWEFIFTSVIVTFILLLFGEILPKVFATYNNRRMAQFGAPVVLVLKTLFRPASWLLVKTGSLIKGKSRDNLSLEELSDALDVTQAQSDEEKQILEGIVSFAGRDVGEIMRPRMDITMLDVEDSFAHVKDVIVKSGFSRIPVYEENIDHIKGILYIKDVVPYISEGDGFGWTRLIRRAHFIPEHKKIDDLLEEFQAGKVHVAIVVDEYGATQGLVSLEDILEEIVGDISDESDTEGELYTRTPAGEYIFDGKVHLGDLERVLGLDEGFFDEVRGEGDTLAGLMLELRRGFLKKGESVETHGIRFTVVSLAARRIEKVMVVIKND